MALLHPKSFPHDLTKKPKLNGEALVFAALASALDDKWGVFYDRPIAGSRRRVDFIAANPDRGLFAIEVKGGLVHDKRGAFRQLISKSGQRKRIAPFDQLKLGLRDLFAAAGIADNAVPVRMAVWFPEMGQAGLRWQPSPHILTRASLEPGAVCELVGAGLAEPLSAKQMAAVGRVLAVLAGKRG